MVKIKKVPKGTTISVAALVCPSGFSKSLPDERPSSWYIFTSYLKLINLSKRGFEDKGEKHSWVREVEIKEDEN